MDDLREIEEWLKGCLRKKIYRTLEFAEMMSNKMEKRFRVPFRVYRCPRCDHFHLTKALDTK